MFSVTPWSDRIYLIIYFYQELSKQNIVFCCFKGKIMFVLPIIIWIGTVINLHEVQSMALKNDKIQSDYQIATLGGGCFWCIEAVFEEVKGIVSVVSGYSGGVTKNPSYHEVCTGTTGHAEVVQIKFDPAIINYKEILDIFFHTHDPTSLNKQGADIGTQYRSVIFYHNMKQQAIAEEIIKELNATRVYSKPIVTQLEKFTAFYLAEEYHQEYFKKNPDAAYCNFVVKPKVDKLKKDYSEMLKR